MSAEQPTPTQPLLTVVSSDVTPEEIAALVAVFSSLGGSAPEAPAPTPEWQAHHRKVRATLPHGAGGWRSSAQPR